MKKNNYKFYLLLTFFIVSNHFASQGAIWLPKASFGGTARQFAVGFSIGAKGYIGTGWDQGIGYRNDFWEYDPVVNSWTQKNNFGGGPRIFAVGFSIGAKGYISTGQDFVGRLKDLWEYNPVTNIWVQKANFGGVPRSRAVGFCIGTKGYVGTGYEDVSNTYYADFWQYDPSIDTWLQKANFGGGVRREAVGFSIGNKGYLGTGYNGTFDKSDFWQYNPATDVWTQKASVGSAQWLAIGFSIGKKGYIGVGYGSSNPLKEFWEYDTTSNTWTRKEDFGGTARFGGCGFAIGMKGYVGTGLDITASRTKDFWEYQPTYIYTGNISVSKICVSKTLPIPISVPYTISASFKSGNVFTAQLSDSSGSFATPLVIGSIADTNAGTIFANIPANTIYGNKYRIRVVSSNPSFFGVDNKKNLSINPKPTPSMTIDDTIQCLVGNVFEFTNTSTVPVGNIGQTIWRYGDAKTGSLVTSNHTYTTDGIFTVEMKAITDSGCSDSVTKSLVVMPAPKASFTCSDTGMCFMGNSFIFTNTSTIKSGSFVSKWYTGNGDSSTNAILNYSYPNPGKFKLKIITSSNLGCTDTASKLIQVDSIPNIGFTIDDSSQCFKNNLFTFTSTSTNAQLYLWNFGDADTSSSKNTTHAYASENSFDVKLKVFSNPKCFDSMIKRVYVYPAPVVSFSINSDTQCLGNNIFNYTNLSTISSGSISSLWDFGDGATSNTHHSNHTYTAAQGYNVKVVVTSDQGCTDSTILPVVLLNSTTSLTSTSNNGPVCEGQQLELYTDTIPFATYLWTGPNSFSSTLQSPVIATAAALDGGTYEVVATSMGCASSPSTTDVIIKPLPDSPSVQSIVNVCEGATLYLNASLSSIASFDWTGPNGFISTLASNVINSATLADAGSYQVSATENGCEGPYSHIMVYVHQKPNVYLGRDTNVCKGDEIFLDPGLFKSYTWQDNSVKRIYSIKEKGKYWVEVVSDYDCVGSDTIEFSDLCPPTFFAPTVFSPNEDTWNDVFKPQGNNIFGFNMKIFDKWGVLIFETNSIELGWDGKYNGTDCPTDLYYWHATWYSTWQGEDKNSSKFGGVYLTR